LLENIFFVVSSTFLEWKFFDYFLAKSKYPKKSKVQKVRKNHKWKEIFKNNMIRKFFDKRAKK